MNKIEKELSQAFDDISLSELDGLIGDIEFPEDKRAGERITRRLFKKEKTMKRTIKRKTSAVLVALAAAMSLTVVAGATGYVIDHLKSIDSFYGEGSGDKLAEKDLILGETFSGEHFNVTVDTALTNGKMAAIVLTVSPTDDFGRQYIADRGDLWLDEKEPISGDMLTGGSGMSVRYEDGNAVIRYEPSLEEYKEGVTLPLELYYYESNDGIQSDTKTMIADINVVLNKNFETRRFTNERGDVIELCDFGWHGENLDTAISALDGKEFQYNTDTVMTLTLEYDDGSSETFTENDFSSISYSSDGTTLFEADVDFSRFIEAERVTAVILSGERFESE